MRWVSAWSTFSSEIALESKILELLVPSGCSDDSRLRVKLWSLALTRLLYISGFANDLASAEG